MFSSYDAWKLRSPDDEASAEACEHCGGWLRRDMKWRWYCRDCEDEMAAIEAHDNDELARLEAHDNEAQS